MFCYQVLVEHEGPVNSVAIANSNKHVVTASQDKTLIIWSLETGLVDHRLEGHTNEVTVVKITSDSCTILSGKNSSFFFFIRP